MGPRHAKGVLGDIASKLTGDEHDDHYYQYQPDHTAGRVTPAPAVRPGGNHAHQRQYQHDQNIIPNEMLFLLLLSAVSQYGNCRLDESADLRALVHNVTRTSPFTKGRHP